MLSVCSQSNFSTVTVSTKPVIIDWSKTGYLIQMVVKGKESRRQRRGKVVVLVGKDMQLEQNPMAFKVLTFFLMPRWTSILHQDSFGGKRNNLPISESCGLKLVGSIFATKREKTMNYTQSTNWIVQIEFKSIWQLRCYHKRRSIFGMTVK